MLVVLVVVTLLVLVVLVVLVVATVLVLEAMPLVALLVVVCVGVFFYLLYRYMRPKEQSVALFTVEEDKWNELACSSMG